MRNFLIIWAGQLVSTFGSRMTSFAVTFWVWDLSGKATNLTLLVFFTQLTQILITPFAGVIVDRSNRKFLIMLGDAVAALCTIVIMLLFYSQHLQIWHLYFARSLSGIFEQLQDLAYTSSITMLISKQQYSRASSLRYLIKYGPKIIAPALAGALYGVIGLMGILVIDLVTFAIAIGTVLPIHIPKPSLPQTNNLRRDQIWQGLYQEIISGYHYLLARPGLLALLLLMSLFWFVHDLGGAVFSPMILARTGNDPAILGRVSAAAGVGGVVGALIMSVWEGPKRKIYGVLIGMIGAGLSKTILGLGQTAMIWIPSQFCSSLNFPLIGGSEQAIWLAKVKPDIQGRVFALSSFSLSITTSISYLIAGPLVDYFLEPSMRPGGKLTAIFGGIFGTDLGAGMALLYVFTSICFLLIGFIGFTLPQLRHLEDELPNWHK